MEVNIYSSNGTVVSSGYLNFQENPIPFPLDKLENVSISASIGASFHEAGGTVVSSGHIDNIVLSINGINYPSNYSFTFRPNYGIIEYLIIPSVFTYLCRYSYVSTDISQPNFGLPIE